MSWLIRHPDLANLFAALLVLVVAFVFYFRGPDRFEKHTCTRWAFHMWVGQWLAFVALFIVFAFVHASPADVSQESLVLLLCFVEVTTVFSLAFFWILLRGDSYSLQRILGWLGTLLVCLLLWDTGYGLLGIEGLASLEWWIFPSRILSMIGLLSMSLVLILRHKLAAVPFLIIGVAYATAQLPVYAATFVTREDVPGLFAALAAGKLLLAATFYPAFFSPASNYNAISFVAPLVAGRRKLVAILIRVGASVLGILLVLFLDVLRQWLLKLFSSLGWVPSG